MYVYKIDKDVMREKLFNWVLGSDGEEGTTYVLKSAIYWNETMNRLIPWDTTVDVEIEDAIGGRGSWNAYSLLRCDPSSEDLGYRKKFLDFIEEKLDNICKVYDKYIDMLNKLTTGHRIYYYAGLDGFLTLKGYFDGRTMHDAFLKFISSRALKQDRNRTDYPVTELYNKLLDPSNRNKRIKYRENNGICYYCMADTYFIDPDDLLINDICSDDLPLDSICPGGSH